MLHADVVIAAQAPAVLQLRRTDASIAAVFGALEAVVAQRARRAGAVLGAGIGRAGVPIVTQKGRDALAVVTDVHGAALSVLAVHGRARAGAAVCVGVLKGAGIPVVASLTYHAALTVGRDGPIDTGARVNALAVWSADVGGRGSSGLVAPIGARGHGEGEDR